MQAEGILSLLGLLAAAALLVRLTRPVDLVDAALSFFLCVAGSIVILAWVLSLFCELDDPAWWLGGTVLVLAAVSGFSFFSKRHGRPGPDLSEGGGQPGAAAVPVAGLERVRLVTLLLAVGLCGIANLVLVIFTAPGTWDCMSYHLARAAYYLQQGSFESYGADYWAQTVHPRNAAALTLFFLGIVGSENLTQAVQYAAWWASAFAVFGVARRSGISVRGSLFAALLFMLLTICLMEAGTAQNDLLLAACLGASLHYLLSCRKDPRLRNFALFGAGLGMAVGTKASALLVLPSLALIGWWVLLRRGKEDGESLPGRRALAAGAGAALIPFCLFTLPSGYLENQKLFGHPLAPGAVREEHSFEGTPASSILEQGLLNVARYGFDFLSLDGVPASRAADSVHEAIRFLPQKLVAVLGIDPESTAGARAPFSGDGPPESHEDTSYWGIFGFALILPLSFLVLLRLLKAPGRGGAGAVLAWAGLLYFLAQCFSGPYDPWRGRYFIALGLFLAPIGGAFLETRKSRIWNGYATLVVLIGSLAALTAVACRDHRPILPVSDSVFQMDRIEQMTANVVLPKRRDLLEQALRKFEEKVPSDAVVATFIQGNSYEYPLFGNGLTRRIIPLNSFLDGPRPVPGEAEYLLFDSTSHIPPMKDDIPLGPHPGRKRPFWFLRPLK